VFLKLKSATLSLGESRSVYSDEGFERRGSDMNIIKKNIEERDALDVFGELQREIGRFVGRSMMPASRWGKTFEPDIDVIEEKERFLVKADLPGFKKEELEIKVEGMYLTLKGERKQEMETKEKNYYACERSYGSFTRVIELPSEVKSDQVMASYKDGVLEIQLPKTESAKAKEIKVEIK
jgi:HSP20 family protein